MKKLLIGLLLIGSLSSFAVEEKESCTVSVKMSHLELFPSEENERYLELLRQDFENRLERKGYSIANEGNHNYAYKFNQRYTSGEALSSYVRFKTSFKSSDRDMAQTPLDIEIEMDRNNYFTKFLSNRKNMGKRAVNKILKKIPNCK